MNQACVGINLPHDTKLSELDTALSVIAADGFDAAEICLSSCPLIIGGKLQQPVLDHMKDVLSRHNLRYTAHIGNNVNPRNPETLALHRATLLASVDACAALGMTPLTTHYEEWSMFTAWEDNFCNTMREVGAYAETKGVAVHIENIEVEYADKALDMILRIGHPNIGMTLDIGHLLLSANYFGYDMMAFVRRCAPYVRHLHVTDNTGDFETMRLTNFPLYNTLDMGYRFTFGRGDIHIPPFWGAAPLDEVFGILRAAGYDGVFLCEYYAELFAPLNGTVCETVRRHIAKS